MIKVKRSITLKRSYSESFFYLVEWFNTQNNDTNSSSKECGYRCRISNGVGLVVDHAAESRFGGLAVHPLLPS